MGPLACNCTIVACPDTKEGLVIDPGGDAPRIIKALSDEGITAVTLVHTHAHFDHILATADVSKATGAETALHADDRWLYDNAALQAQLFGLTARAPEILHRELAGGETLAFGRRDARVIHTPGHSPGSVCLYLQFDDEQPLLFSGDTLFAGAVGRTDLWGGSFEQLSSSIRGPLFELPEDTLVIPGHGDETHIGQEREDNPFVGRRARLRV